jgi:hypothetical protein
MEVTTSERTFLRQLMYLVGDAETAVAGEGSLRAGHWRRRWRRVQREAHWRCESGAPIVEMMLGDYFCWIGQLREEGRPLTEFDASEAAEALATWIEAGALGSMLSGTLCWEQNVGWGNEGSVVRGRLWAALIAGESLAR